MKQYLILDGYNLIHRARGGFSLGEWPIVFNFFRGLRPFIEKYKPHEAFIVLEGTPKRNLELLPEYKANRGLAPDGFERQKEAIIDILASVPITIVHHPDFEADDVVHNLIQELDGHVTVISSDSDFTQLLQGAHASRVTVYNWREKVDLVAPEYDYIRWKALRGDPTDNIPKCPGMTEGAALAAAKDDNRLAVLMQDAAFRKAYERNLELVRLQDFTVAERAELVLIPGVTDWDNVRMAFGEYDFNSIIREPTWSKYIKTFKCIGRED